MKIGFTKPFINCGKIAYTQLSIPFGRAKAEAAKKRYMAAYFDVVPEVGSKPVEESPAPRETQGSDIEDFGKLGLRTLRKLARFLGVAQKVGGKDRSKASFVEVLEELLETDRERVSEALAAVG